MKISKQVCLILVVVLSITYVRSAESNLDCRNSTNSTNNNNTKIINGGCGYCARITVNTTDSAKDSLWCSLCSNGYKLNDSNITFTLLKDDKTPVIFNDSCHEPPAPASKSPSNNLPSILVFSLLLLLVVISVVFVILYFCLKKGPISKGFSSKPKDEKGNHKPSYGEFIVPVSQVTDANNSVNNSLIRGPSGKQVDSLPEPQKQAEIKTEMKTPKDNKYGEGEQNEQKGKQSQTLKKKRVIPKKLPSPGLMEVDTSNDRL